MSQPDGVRGSWLKVKKNWIWIIVGSIAILALLWICIQAAFFGLTRSTCYPIPTEYICDPIPYPTTTAEMPPRKWGLSPLAIEGDRYNFATGVCDADWLTGDSARIPCTGAENDPYGMVMAVKQPAVENDMRYASALWVRPSPEYCWSEGELGPTKHQPAITGIYNC